MRKIAAYGSLRQGFHNHGWLGTGSQLLEKTTVHGAMLLRGNSYPLLFLPDEAPAGSTVEEHIIEIYELSQQNYDRIRAIEIASGYKVSPFEHPDETITDAVIFWADPRTAHVDKFDLPIKAYTTDIYKIKS